MRPSVAIAAAAALLLLLNTSLAAAEEPWSDADPKDPPSRFVLDSAKLVGFRGGAEYRANAVAISPLDLSSTRDRNFSIIEHRLRLDATLDYDDKVKLTTSIDVLDGVLWGDNGTLGQAPESTSGASVSTTNPNVAGACVVQRPSEPQTEATSYHLGPCAVEPVFVRRLYGDVMTPVGLLRIGRQPFTDGASISVNDGDGRRNRFGFARRGQSADRVLFATKPLEALKLPAERDTSVDTGLVLVLAYDRYVTDDPMRFKDDLHGTIEAVRFRKPTYPLGEDLELRVFHAFRFSSAYDTNVHAVGGRAMSRFGDFGAGAELATIAGSTREIGEAFGVITGDPAVDQPIRQFGARGVGRWDTKYVTLYFETDYASGDSDPRTGTPLTQFRFADDTNVGLLMFKHVLAYQSARAAAAGTALLRSLGATTYPNESVATRGAFTNAFAIFPQVDVRPIPDLLFRGGVLMAWAPAKVVDPIASLQRRDGVDIADDLVNFAGGRPHRYYGTELDGRIQYRMYEHFAADLEGAVLFPGSALEDANGDAVRSVLVQARVTFFL